MANQQEETGRQRVVKVSIKRPAEVPGFIARALVGSPMTTGDDVVEWCRIAGCKLAISSEGPVLMMALDVKEGYENHHIEDGDPFGFVLGTKDGLIEVAGQFNSQARVSALLDSVDGVLTEIDGGGGWSFKGPSSRDR